MRKIGIVFLLAVALVACSQPINANDYAQNDLPGIQVDRTRANVGDPVTVTLTGGFKLEEESRRAEDVIHNLSLGACISSEELAQVGGLCGIEGVPMPETFQLLNGTAVAKSYGDFVVKRGEYRRIKHTFVFTSTEPGEVEVSSVAKIFHGPEHKVAALLVGSSKRIIFE